MYKRQVYGYHKPLLGVNKGYLGFLTEVEINELEAYLEAFLSGDFHMERRMMLTAEVYRNGQKLRELTGLNDLVITKGALARIISVEIEMDGAMVDQFLGDGVIFSTSTGSTGYSLSAGGPIVYPNFDVCILAPICPHSLSARSMIFPPESVLRVHLGLENFQAMLTVDGQYGMELENKDCLLYTSSLLRSLWVKGEISNYKRHSSGHLYFSLKDATGTIKCVMFRSNASRLRFEPEHGMEVVAMGYVSVFERDGAYQLYVEDMLAAGAGALHIAYEKLKSKLEAEGLFEDVYKRQL